MIVKKRFPVVGLGCASCAARVERVLREHEGVREASVNFASLMASVEFDDAVCSAEGLARAVSDAGYGLVVEPEGEDEAPRKPKGFRDCLMAVALTVPAVLLCIIWSDLDGVPFFMWILSTPVVFRCGRRFFASAWRQARHGQASMDTLVALSTGIAYFFSLFNLFFPEFWLKRGLEPHVYFESAAGVVTFVLIGRMLEARAKAGTTSAIRGLMALRPDMVKLLAPDGSPSEVALKSVRVGDLVLLRPGDKVPVDGVVTEGSSFIDESSLSGEPLPVEKTVGAQVLAGTLNHSGSLTIRATGVGSATMLAHIIEMVESAQGSKAPVQRLADRVASVFVPCVMGLSLLTFGLWLLIGGWQMVGHAIMAAVTVLVIACPCALGLATPTAITVGIGRGARRGILIRDAASLETAAKTRVVVLDKTGTLTEGRPRVVAERWVARREALAPLLGSLESLSAHPIAAALTERYGSGPERVEQFREIAGRGVEGLIGGKTYRATNAPASESDGASSPDEPAATKVYFYEEDSLLATIYISDEIKAGSPEAVSALRQRGIDVYMLTGDNEASALSIARKAGIDASRVRAAVMPAGKAEFVRQLRQRVGHVAMVGDGINDSAALAEADLSIAMGSGSDVAKDVASLTIMHSDLRRVAEAVSLSEKTVGRIRQNLFWAFIYNVVAIPIAAGALFPLCGFMLNPMIAGAAMAMSSLSVVANSLRP